MSVKTPVTEPKAAIVKPDQDKNQDKRKLVRQEHSHFTNRADNRSE